VDTNERSNRLADLREEVNRVNASILGLLNRRTELVDRILEEKRVKGITLFDPQRESHQLG